MCGNSITLTLRGLNTCDSCRQARKTLVEAGRRVAFIDVRETPPARAELARWLEAFGGDLVNRRSATWRGLGEEDRAGDPIALLMAHPTLMKRPLIEGPGGATLGWNPATRERWLGAGAGDPDIPVS